MVSVPDLCTLTYLEYIQRANNKGDGTVQIAVLMQQKVSDYEQEMPQSYTIDQPMAPRGRVKGRNLPNLQNLL